MSCKKNKKITNDKIKKTFFYRQFIEKYSFLLGFKKNIHLSYYSCSNYAIVKPIIVETFSTVPVLFDTNLHPPQHENPHSNWHLSFDMFRHKRDW